MPDSATPSPAGPGRIPQSEGLGSCRGGTTTIGTIGKRGDAEGTRPQTHSVCFPSTSYFMLFLFSMLCLMTYYLLAILGSSCVTRTHRKECAA